MNVSLCMKRKVFSILPQASIGTAVRIFSDHRIGTLPVVDETNYLVGLVNLADLLQLTMPDFVNLIENLDFIQNFGIFEENAPGRDLLEQPVQKIMKPPISVDGSAGLHYAASLFYKHDIRDLPVVDLDGKLVGIISFVDIGIALLSRWQIGN